jgi:hypothetical protein
VYSFKQFLLSESKKPKNPDKKKTDKKKEKVEDSSLPRSKEATHAGMSFYSPGEL